MADEEGTQEKGASKAAVNISLVNINVQADALGLGKASEHASPVALEIVRAFAAAIGKVYKPIGIIAEGAANRHVRVQNLKAEAKLLQELGDKLPPERLIVEGEILPPAPALEKPKTPRARRSRPKGNTIGFVTRLQTPPTVELRPRSDKALRTRARRLNETNELRWQENIESSFAKAFELAQDSSSEAKVYRPRLRCGWVEGVKNVSNEEIQILGTPLVQAPTEEEGRIPTAVVNFLAARPSWRAQQIAGRCRYRLRCQQPMDSSREESWLHEGVPQCHAGSLVSKTLTRYLCWCSSVPGRAAGNRLVILMLR